MLFIPVATFWFVVKQITSAEFTENRVLEYGYQNGFEYGQYSTVRSWICRAQGRVETMKFISTLTVNRTVMFFSVTIVIVALRWEDLISCKVYGTGQYMVTL